MSEGERKGVEGRGREGESRASRAVFEGIELNIDGNLAVYVCTISPNM